MSQDRFSGGVANRPNIRAGGLHEVVDGDAAPGIFYA
jgi:hypothetical protein